jgi:outer membrane protein OmpA-like peptidoglycan-associated protein
VDGGTLVLRAARWTSGDITVTVTVTDERGGTVTATVRDRVTPPAPRHVGRRLSPAGTQLSWSPAPTRNASYDVLVDGDVVCHTSRTTCSLSDVLGPERIVSVRTVGHDATRSVPTGAPLRGHGQVLVTTVYFASGEDRLTAQDHRILDAAIREVHRFGFGRANLDGYTDADGGLAFNMVLSHHRTQAVALYLREHGAIGNVQAWHGEADPVASNSESQGKARNRRVEVLVRY